MCVVYGRLFLACGVNFVLSVMRVVEGVLLWVVCVFVVLVSGVHPFAILSLVFFIILKFVSDASGDHMVETYAPIGIVMAEYVASIVSFCFPHVSVFKYLYCCACFCCRVSLGSRVSHSIMGLMFMGRVVLFSCSASCVLYSAGHTRSKKG